MVAESPDYHRGDPGRLEIVKTGLIGADTVGHKRSNRYFFFALF